MKKRFLLLLLTGLLSILSEGARAQDSLVISEVADPADDYSGRFVELYNTGSETIDFDSITFYLSRQSNGGTSWGDLRLAGSVGSHRAFVIGGSGFEAIYGFAPDQESGILTGNGDDAYSLYREGDHENGILLDIYGATDTDGTGEPWEYEDSRAERSEAVLAPSSLWVAGQWEITPAGVADCDPGTHHGSVMTDTISHGSYTMSVSSDTVELGQPVEVSVSVNALTDADSIISFQFDLSYDDSVLEYDSFTLSGTMAEGGEAVVNTDMAGKLAVGFMSAEVLTGEGVILKLHFNSLVQGSTDLNLSDAWINTTLLTDLVNGSLLIIESAPPSAYIIYSDTVNRFADTLIITAIFDKPISITEPLMLSLSGAAELSAGEMNRLNDTVYNYLFQIPGTGGVVFVALGNATDLAGNEVISEPTGGGSFLIRAFTPGDVDDDGRILAYDAAITLQYSVGIDPLPGTDPTPWEPWRDSTANVDGTGGITAYDASLILRYATGLISGFPGGPFAVSEQANVSVEVVDQAIVFYSSGDLYGFNLDVSNEDGILEAPEALAGEYLSAVNIDGSDYRIGLSAVSPARDGEVLLKIPYHRSGSATFHLTVNSEERIQSADLVTGLTETGKELIEIGPNPAREWLRIGNLKGASTVGIYNIHGRLLYRTGSPGPRYEIDLAGFPAGLYMIVIRSGETTVARKFCIF